MSLTVSSFALGGGGRGGGRVGVFACFPSLIWPGPVLVSSGDLASKRGSGSVTSDTSTSTLSAVGDRELCTHTVCTQHSQLFVPKTVGAATAHALLGHTALTFFCYVRNTLRMHTHTQCSHTHTHTHTHTHGPDQHHSSPWLFHSIYAFIQPCAVT